MMKMKMKMMMMKDCDFEIAFERLALSYEEDCSRRVSFYDVSGRSQLKNCK